MDVLIFCHVISQLPQNNDHFCVQYADRGVSPMRAKWRGRNLLNKSKYPSSLKSFFFLYPKIFLNFKEQIFKEETKYHLRSISLSEVYVSPFKVKTNMYIYIYMG